MVYHIPCAWASALSVSTVGQCEKPRVVGWATGKIPTLFVSMGLINNLKTFRFLGILSEKEYEGIEIKYYFIFE